MQQQQIADRFRRLEQILLRMSKLSEATDARRAVLLKKAVAQSRDRLMDVQFRRLVELLGEDRLGTAIENESELDQDLRALLELLQSEDRAKRIKAEKARIRAYLKQLGRILRHQKDLQGRTEAGDNPPALAGEQDRVAKRTGELAEEMKENEESDEESSGSRAEGEGEAEGKGSGKGQGEGEGKGQGEDEGDGQGEGQGGGQGDGQGQSQGQGGQGGEQGGGPSGQQPPQDEGYPPRKRLDAARERMEQARKKLEEAEKKGAVEEQEQAIRELEQAKAELEKVLRQLREEEIERMLAVLEARFRRMLELQREVYEGTVRLDKVPDSQWAHNHEIQAGRLSSQESEIVVEADKASLLLREDGTAVAFPEAVDQMKADMQQVVQRLGRTKVGSITQAVEQDVIAALEEMIEALKRAREEMEERRQNGSPPPGEPEDPPLIDMLAEVKMIRALQMRVNRRTDRYAKLVDGEQAEDAELIEALERLARRQERIHQVTRDLEIGKNK